MRGDNPFPDAERWALLGDEEMATGIHVDEWLRQQGFDLLRPIQRLRSEMRRGDYFVQYADNRKSIHNINAD